MDPIATRPQDKGEALDQALAECVSRVKNDAAIAAPCFAIMKETLESAPSAAVCLKLVKKLAATALVSWTPPTCDPEGFAAVAKTAGFHVETYGAGKHPGPAVVREAAYAVSTSAPLSRALCRTLADAVFAFAVNRLLSYDDFEARLFAQHLPALLRTGSLESPSSPKLPATARYLVS